MDGDTPQVGKFVCCGVRIDELGPEEAVETLLRSRFGQTLKTHLCNAFTLSVAFRDRSFASLLNRSDINFADGHYVAMVGRWRGTGVMRARTYGPALMIDVIARGCAGGLKHYLYGSTPDNIRLLEAAIREAFPEAKIVGAESPPFRPLTLNEEEHLVQRVREAKPDIVWVGLGTPLQDHFVEKYGDRLQCGLVPVGAAFDFHAGTKVTAPRFMQDLGLEWFFRLMTEPVRLWRRYLFGIPIFLAGVIRDMWRRPDPSVSGKVSDR